MNGQIYHVHGFNIATVLIKLIYKLNNPIQFYQNILYKLTQ